MICKLFSDQDLARIHEASLHVLERTGVQVPHDDVLGRFAACGAHVDCSCQRVRIPPDLVMRLLDQAGKRFTIYGRDLERKAEFGAGRRNYNSVAGEAHWVDEMGGPRRPAAIADVATAARLGDALEGINIVGAMADPADLPTSMRCVAVMAEVLKNTTKPVTFWFHDRASARYLIDMMIALRGDEQRAARYPVCYPFLEPISPLRFPFHGVDLLYETARLNLPVPIGPMAQVGLSAPGTLAGTMVQENAEILAGICITQLIRPGTPVCYGGIPHAFDMRTTQLIFAGPEQAIFGVAMTEMGRFYGFPVYVNVGLTDSKRVDAQAGLEAGITLAMGAAAGADIFGHMGISGVDQASSPDMLVFQDEVIRFVESMLRPLGLSDESLAVEEIIDAGPGGRHIDREFTARHFRKELWFPRLLDRRYYDSWLDGGATSMEARCRAHKEEIVSGHQPKPLPDDIASEVDRIVAAARRHLAE